MDHETIYRLLYAQEWAALLEALHIHHQHVAEDPLLAHAIETFLSAFFEALPEGEDPAYTEALEKLFLLHTGRFYTLSAVRFERVVETLARLHTDRPEAALGYARFCPTNAYCATLLEQHAASVPEPPAYTTQADLDLAVSTPLGEVDHTISLFKSQQEVDFFLAVREVYATYFVYPNVALSCLVDYTRIKAELSAAGRQYFFRAIIDCVVFDQHDGYRPRYFFEVDSTLHDTPERRAKDQLKEHILAVSGQTLYRIRKRDREQGREAFITLLKQLAEDL